MMQRRQWLQTAALMSLPWKTHAATRHSPASGLAATWSGGPDGTFWAGLMVAQNQALHAHARIELPTRGHGLLPGPKGDLLVVARRPGEWLLRWWPTLGARQMEWVWALPERSFNGHAVWSADGKRLFTTETNLGSGAGLVGVRDAHSLQLLAEWPTHGLDPHELLLDGEHLIIANGGIRTQVETGRAKPFLDSMDASLVRLHSGTGEWLGQWRLEDRHLSIRHMACMPATLQSSPCIGIALQAEHANTAQRAAAPVLAVFDGTALRTASVGNYSLEGYGGSIEAFAEHFWISCPRANGVAKFNRNGEWQGFTPLREACPITADPSRQQLWLGGHGTAIAVSNANPPPSSSHSISGLQLDNHWRWLPAPLH